MDSLTKTVTSVGELVAATHDGGVRRILVSGEFTDAPSFRLAPGQHLVGVADGAAIVFHTGVDGLQLTTDNAVQNVRLQTSPEQRVVYNDTGVDTLGRIVLDQVTTVGQVQLLAGIKSRVAMCQSTGWTSLRQMRSIALNILINMGWMCGKERSLSGTFSPMRRQCSPLNLWTSQSAVSRLL
jgi:hypothetical protein